MKLLHLVGLILISSMFGIFGCSGSNSSYYSGGGSRCPENYNPLPTTNLDKSVFKDRGDISGNIFPGDGTYRFAGMEVFYRDLTNGAQIHTRLIASPDATQSSIPSIVCTRNMDALRIDAQRNSNGKPILFGQSMPSVRTLTVDSKGVLQFYTYEHVGYLFNIGSVGPGIRAVNCDVSKDPHSADTNPSKEQKQANNKLCGPQTSAMGASLLDLYKAAPGTSTYAYCFAWPGDDSCENPEKAKNLAIRYTITRTSDKGDFHQEQVEVISNFVFTPNDPKNPPTIF